jgi:wyosine [tRNA(Phe)-imidazoG37] synthetase (radical SAM superfamily)
VFLLAGVTTPEMEINRLKTCINAICPDKVQVNTVTRPPAEGFAEPVPQKRLQTITERLYEKAEVIADYSNVHRQQDFSARREAVLTLLKRRPCSVEDIALGLGFHQNAVAKCLEQLCSQQQARVEYTTQGVFYKALNLFKEQEGHRKWN